MEDFDEMNNMRFSWTGLFAVTSISCFVFSIFLKLTEDENTPWLLISGAIAVVITFFCYFLKKQKDAKKKLRKRSSIFNKD